MSATVTETEKETVTGLCSACKYINYILRTQIYVYNIPFIHLTRIFYMAHSVQRIVCSVYNSRHIYIRLLYIGIGYYHYVFIRTCKCMRRGHRVAVDAVA